jgi:DNA processing protein
MTNKDIKYWVGFSRVPRIGRVKLSRLESQFGSMEEAWRATPDELSRSNLDKGSVKAIVDWRPKISLDEEMEKL